MYIILSVGRRIVVVSRIRDFISMQKFSQNISMGMLLLCGHIDGGHIDELLNLIPESLKKMLNGDFFSGVDSFTVCCYDSLIRIKKLNVHLVVSSFEHNKQTDNYMCSA